MQFGVPQMRPTQCGIPVFRPLQNSELCPRCSCYLALLPLFFTLSLFLFYFLFAAPWPMASSPTTRIWCSCSTWPSCSYVNLWKAIASYKSCQWICPAIMVSLMQHQRTIPYSPANWDRVSAVATRIAGHCGFCRCQQKLKVSESLWQIEFVFHLAWFFFLNWSLWYIQSVSRRKIINLWLYRLNLKYK